MAGGRLAARLRQSASPAEHRWDRVVHRHRGRVHRTRTRAGPRWNPREKTHGQEIRPDRRGRFQCGDAAGCHRCGSAVAVPLLEEHAAHGGRQGWADQKAATRQADHDRGRLPRCRIMASDLRRLELRSEGTTVLGDSTQTAVDGHRPLGGHGPIEHRHRGDPSSRSSCLRRSTGAASHQNPTLTPRRSHGPPRPASGGHFSGGASVGARLGARRGTIGPTPTTAIAVGGRAGRGWRLRTGTRRRRP